MGGNGEEEGDIVERTSRQMGLMYVFSYSNKRIDQQLDLMGVSQSQLNEMIPVGS
jgi:hypothetical protein